MWISTVSSCKVFVNSSSCPRKKSSTNIKRMFKQTLSAAICVCFVWQPLTLNGRLVMLCKHMGSLTSNNTQTHTRTHHASTPPLSFLTAFSSLTLLVGWQEGHPVCKKTEWWDSGVIICLGRGADVHMAQMMLLPLTISCSSKSRLVLPFWYRLTQVIPDKVQGAIKRL